VGGPYDNDDNGGIDNNGGIGKVVVGMKVKNVKNRCMLELDTNYSTEGGVVTTVVIVIIITVVLLTIICTSSA
jgi:hypothetical protein